ncbi:MAG: universal stress protein, partial [Tepidisphaeraceae bacterium]
VFEARYKAGEQLVADMQRLVPANLTSQTRVLLGQPAQEIVWCARNWRADLVVVGDHNRHAVTRFFVGSTTDAVLRHAPCPVLVIREIDRSSPIRDTTPREAEPAVAAVSRTQ